MIKLDAMDSPRRRRRRHRDSSPQKIRKQTTVDQPSPRPSDEKFTNKMESQHVKATTASLLPEAEPASAASHSLHGSNERQSTSRGRGDRKSSHGERSGSRKKKHSSSRSRRSESPKKSATSRHRRSKPAEAKEGADGKKSRVDSLVDDLRKEYESPRRSRSPNKKQVTLGEKIASGGTVEAAHKEQKLGDATAKAVSPSPADQMDSGYETPTDTERRHSNHRTRSRSRSKRSERKSSGRTSSRRSSIDNSQCTNKRKKDSHRVSPPGAESPAAQEKRHPTSPKKLKTPKTPNSSRSYRGHRTIVPDIIAPPITTDGSYHKSYIDRPQREFIDALDWKGFSPVAHTRKVLKVFDMPKPPLGLNRSLHSSQPMIVGTSESDDSSQIYKTDTILSQVRDWNKEYVPTKRQAHRKSTVEYHNQKLHMSTSATNLSRSSRSVEIARLLESLGDEKKNARYLERAKQRHAQRRSSDPLKNDHRFSRSSDIVFSPVALAAVGATTAKQATAIPNPVPVL